MASFEEIDEAQRLLGLGKFASLKDVKKDIKQACTKKAFCIIQTEAAHRVSKVK
jgi:hypothetical protein